MKKTREQQNGRFGSQVGFGFFSFSLSLSACSCLNGTDRSGHRKLGSQQVTKEKKKAGLGTTTRDSRAGPVQLVDDRYRVKEIFGEGQDCPGALVRC